MSETTAATPILVLGGTSLIGRHLLKDLRAQERPFTAISRDPPMDGGSEWLRGDQTHGDLVGRLPQAETALSLSPVWLLPTALPALAAAGVKRLVAFSSTSRTTKADSPSPEERAVAARLTEGEAETERFCEAHEITWTVLRPTLIYSEGEDANISRLAALIRRFGVLPLSGFGGGLRQPVHAADLAQAALAVIDREQTFNRAYDLPGGETLTYRVMVERVFEGLGRKPRIIALPPPIWRFGLSLMGSRLPDATAAMGARMGEDLAFDPVPARRDFNWAARPFRPLFELAQAP
ncbi:SDR family oxidoreductase [Caulobacter sp. S45]|uniref:SDR family oxidoreductase n=1 Tax=Caulobacter sp. S45 TaxID=1641861 RepID=UPI00131C25BF|nr:NAD-dependent epimerase/dehydratase family protein [Caulobacter sp. S45]